MEKDIRWQQRFDNYRKAIERLRVLTEFYESPQDADSVIDDAMREGLIQRFEYTFELAWNVMRDYLNYQGNLVSGGPREVFREAFQMQLIVNGDVWMDMIKSRNLTSHTYNEETANGIFEKVMSAYYPEFIRFMEMMESKYEDNGL